MHENRRGEQEDVASRAAQVGRSPSEPRCNHATGGGRCEQDTANGPALAEITARVPVVVSIRGHQPVDLARRKGDEKAARGNPTVRLKTAGVEIMSRHLRLR